MTEAAQKWEEVQVAYRGKVRTFARNSFRQIPGYSLEDVEQELLVVLWQTSLKFDSKKGVKFNTLFQTNAKNRIITLIRHSRTKSRTASLCSLDEDAVRLVAENYAQTYSAEEQAMLRIDLVEAVRSRGVECLDGPKRGRRRRVS